MYRPAKCPREDLTLFTGPARNVCHSYGGNAMTDYITPELCVDATDIQIEKRYAVIRMSDRVVAASVLLAREFARVCVKQKETEMVADLHRSNMRREETPD